MQVTSDLECLISRHFSKSLLQFFCDGFELLLLRNKFIFKSVNFLLQFLNRFVSKLCSCLCLLQFGSEGFDLFLVGLFALVGFFFSNLKRLQIVGNNSKLFLQLQDLGLSNICSFSKPAILLSSSTALFSKTFLARSESSAAVPALSSLVFAATNFSSVFSRSSSRP